MKSIISILISYCLIFSLACKNDQNKSTVNNSSNNSTPAPKQIDGNQQYLPSISVEEISTMWTECDAIDYVFHNLGISSSVDDNPSARVHLRHISEAPASIKDQQRCPKGIGRLFYKTQGEDLIEAEVHFGGGCAFYVFHKNGKAVYSNLMTPAGVDHFNQIIAMATQARNGQ